MPSPIHFGALMPHPPLLIESIGKEETKVVHRTQKAMQDVSKEIVESQPDVVVFISPHGPMFEDAVSIMDGDCLAGDLKKFGVAQQYRVPNDRQLARAITEHGKREGIPIVFLEEQLKKNYMIQEELDYGAIVPYHYLREAGYEGNIVLLTPGFLPFERTYRAGMCLREAIEELGRNAVIIASGDNSHALQENSPAGSTVEGRAFDALLQKAISRLDWVSLYELEHSYLERAAEDTLGSLFLLLGAFDGFALLGTPLSYEAPFGVGYTVATMYPSEVVAPSLLMTMDAIREARINLIRTQESVHALLARTAVETYAREDRVIQLATIPTEFAMQAGCFVSIKQNGRLRGCIGTVRPSTDNLSEEIIHNAIAACSQDDRFFPVEEEELAELTYSVDVLEPEEEVKDPNQLDPSIYGLIVTDGERSGLLLPNLEGIHSIEEQIKYAREKAGIHPQQQNVKMYRFRVQRYM